MISRNKSNEEYTKKNYKTSIKDIKKSCRTYIQFTKQKTTHNDDDSPQIIS